MTQILPYFGSGPYCFTNSLISALGPDAPSPAIVETLTGSPFGFQWLAGRVPLFDPFGWDPDLGLDQALDLLGYTCRKHTSGSANEAMSVLRRHVRDGPVVVGPLDMGLLLHQPGSDRASGADHFVTVLDVQHEEIIMHDPQGHPWATLPVQAFCRAWKAEEIGYGEAYAMRTDFQRVRSVTPLDALRQSLPYAAAWLNGCDLPVPPGTLGGRAGLEALADRVEDRLSKDIQQLLIHFGLRVGTRRKADAAHALHLIGEDHAAQLLQEQARTLGALQYPAIQGQGSHLATGFRRLGELHDKLTSALSPYAEA
ncbi:hypothetical protein QOL99_01980 [Deinococcus sp. MIMF12]|uniref:Uncharacterized protein n=1 Tax=Deinococcus rhizophilus TaxID=3049544 RepID=A0ABT7JD93_9DEIO|nr:hypothetical protein [Deinococcus rhizophilus]MDL2342911.1 hypothetical protein [Deinococcus rhizophilus]